MFKDRLFWVLTLVASATYMLNPGMGIFELIPDNLPFIGNFDEMWAVLILLRSLVELKMIPADKVDRLLNLKKNLISNSQTIESQKD
jgi:hypothetical protein